MFNPPNLRSGTSNLGSRTGSALLASALMWALPTHATPTARPNSIAEASPSASSTDAPYTLTRTESLKIAQAQLPTLRAVVARSLSTLLGESSARVHTRADRVGPSLILKLNLALNGIDTRVRSEDFLVRATGLWGASEVYIKAIEERAGRAIVELNARIGGLPVLNQQSRLSIRDGVAQHLSNGIGALTALIPARVDEAQARAAALKALTRDTLIQGARAATAQRGAVSYSPGVAFEVFEVRLVAAARARTWVALIDGRDGAVIQLRSGEVR